jgi:hypothetical protein
MEGYIGGSFKAPEMELVVRISDTAKKVTNPDYVMWVAQDQ